MARKTKTERISEIELQIEQLANQKKQLEAQERERARKERTKRLIERGAILESIISGADTLTNEQVKALLEKAFTASGTQRNLDHSRQKAAENPTATADDNEEDED